MSAVTFGLLAAIANSSQAILSKGLTDRYPARQLISLLLLLNCLLLLPLAPFVEWHWNPEIVGLHAASAILMIVTSVAVWDMFDSGAASATTTATALSPIPAAIGAVILLPGSVTVLQAVAAAVVVVGVVWALRDAFAGLGRRGSVIRILVAATGTGLLTVATRLLFEQDVGVVETYVVRTGLAAAFFLLVIPPRDVPRSATGGMLLRSVAVTLSFVFVILGVQRGSPVVVQTLIAITPLLILGWESFRTRTWPPTRALAGAALVAAGVAIVLVV